MNSKWDGGKLTIIPIANQLASLDLQMKNNEQRKDQQVSSCHFWANSEWLEKLASKTKYKWFFLLFDNRREVFSNGRAAQAGF